MLPSRPVASRQRLYQLLAPHLDAAARQPGLDRYRKVFPARAHLWILVLHVLDGASSLRQTHARLRLRTRLWQAWGMRRFVSRSQLARSTTSRPTSGAQDLLARLYTQALRRPVADPDLRLLLRVEAVDSTFLTLSQQLAPWSQHGQTAAGTWVQCGLDLARGLPTWLALHTRAANDRAALSARALEDLRGWTLLFDRGYYAHTLFADLLAHGVDFITRRYAPASYRVVGQLDVVAIPLAGGERILADLVILLGSPHNRTSTVVPDLRLIQYQTADGKAHEVLTSRHDLTAAEVIMLYRKRWQIELFFRLLKRQLGLLRLLGQSPQAVWLTLLLAAIVAVLLVLTAPLQPPDTSQVAWTRLLAVLLSEMLMTRRC